MSTVAGSLLFAVLCVLLVICWLLLADRCLSMSFGACCLLYVVCCLLLVRRCLRLTGLCLSDVAC